jgi:hypothetical protein
MLCAFVYSKVTVSFCFGGLRALLLFRFCALDSSSSLMCSVFPFQIQLTVCRLSPFLPHSTSFSSSRSCLMVGRSLVPVLFPGLRFHHPIFSFSGHHLPFQVFCHILFCQFRSVLPCSFFCLPFMIALNICWLKIRICSGWEEPRVPGIRSAAGRHQPRQRSTRGRQKFRGHQLITVYVPVVYMAWESPSAKYSLSLHLVKMDPIRKNDADPAGSGSLSLVILLKVSSNVVVKQFLVQVEDRQSFKLPKIKFCSKLQ